MAEPDLVRLFVEPLERLGLEYMVTGGVAAVAYGDPRFTRDVDLVISLAEEIGRIDGGRFNVIHRDTGLRADIYLTGDDPFHRWALSIRYRIEMDGGSIHLTPIRPTSTPRDRCPRTADSG